MRGAPFLANLTREQATSMNARMRKVPEERTPAQVHGAVQAVHSCPWPECMVLRCFHHSLIGQLGPNNLTAQASRSGVIRAYTRQTQDIEGFVASAPSKTKLRVGMQRNFAQVAAMIKAHPCLKRDFQVFCPTMVVSQHRSGSLQAECIWICIPQRYRNESTGTRNDYSVDPAPEVHIAYMNLS